MAVKLLSTYKFSTEDIEMEGGCTGPVWTQEFDSI